MARRLFQKKSAGFSLVELMIVVAIITVLSTVAVPTYRRMVARAKKSEAKVALGGVFTTEQTFQAEFQVYGSNLVAMGFELGQQRNPIYSVGFPNGACNNIAIVPPNIAGNPITNDINDRNPIYYTGPYQAVMGRAAGAGFAVACSAGNIDNAAGTYLATATGAISAGVPANSGNLTQAACNANNGVCQDVWTINQNRDLRNVADGANH